MVGFVVKWHSNRKTFLFGNPREMLRHRSKALIVDDRGVSQDTSISQLWDHLQAVRVNVDQNRWTITLGAWWEQNLQYQDYYLAQQLLVTDVFPVTGANRYRLHMTIRYCARFTLKSDRLRMHLQLAMLSNVSPRQYKDTAFFRRSSGGSWIPFDNTELQAYILEVRAIVDRYA